MITFICKLEQEIVIFDLLYIRTDLRTVARSLMAPGCPRPCGWVAACTCPPSSSFHAAGGWRTASGAAGRRRRGGKAGGGADKEDVLGPRTMSQR